MAERLPLGDTVLDEASSADPAEPHLVLWNTQAFYDLRPDLAGQRVRLDHADPTGRLVGSFVGGVVGDRCTSGLSAPFGGVDVVRGAETVANVADLVDAALDRLEIEGMREVEVRAKPPHYGPDEAALAFTLLNRGFSVSACDLNAYLDLGPWPGVDDYVADLKPAARKALRRAQGLGLEVYQAAATDEAAWSEAYEVLRRNRVDRGRPMRLELDYVRRIRDAFPGRVRMLAIASEGSVCAAALLYRVAPGRDLVQYWGDSAHALPQSPMNLLVHAVVEHSIASGAATVDIGISSEDGVPNHGLIQFKRSVGCQIEPRLRFEGRLG